MDQPVPNPDGWIEIWARRRRARARGAGARSGRGSGLVDPPGRWAVGAKGENPHCRPISLLRWQACRSSDPAGRSGEPCVPVVEPLSRPSLLRRPPIGRLTACSSRAPRSVAPTPWRSVRGSAALRSRHTPDIRRAAGSRPGSVPGNARRTAQGRSLPRGMHGSPRCCSRRSRTP